MLTKLHKTLLISTITLNCFFTTTTKAADLYITDGSPTLFFNDTQTDVGASDWAIYGDGNLNGGFFEIKDFIGSSNNVVLNISHSDNNKQTFMVDTSGDINLADGSVFIDRSANNIGVGTTAPDEELHITSAYPSIILEEVNPANKWQMYAVFDQLRFGSLTSPAGTIFAIDKDAPQHALVVEEAGVGLGTNLPESALHIKKDDAVLKVEDTNITPAVRTVVQLKNQGAVGFSMEDTSQPVTWDFRTSGTGNFIMNDVGDGAEVTVLRNGNMIISGTVIEGSSRDIKTDFDAIKSKDFMEKLSKVEVLEWRYKDADKADRHIGPIAEDFYKLFKLGPDNKHISPRDVASIALLAAKELQKQSESKALKTETHSLRLETQTLKAENVNLRQRLETQSERLASMEKLLGNLIAANGMLEGKGKKVALNK